MYIWIDKDVNELLSITLVNMLREREKILLLRIIVLITALLGGHGQAIRESSPLR